MLAGRLRAAALLLFAGLAVVTSKKTRTTFQRMQQTAGQQATSGSTSGPTNNIIPSQFAPLGSMEKLAFIQNLVKNGMDTNKLVTDMLNHESFQKIYDHPEVLHKLLEANPLLEAFDGFKQASRRRLNDQDTAAAFKTGVQGLMKVVETTSSSYKDPSTFMKDLSDLTKTEDPEVQSAMEEAKGGSSSGMTKLQTIVAEKNLPGFDFSKFQEAAKAMTFDRMLEQPELMHFIDQNEYLSDVFRKGDVLPSKVQGAYAEQQRNRERKQ